MADKDVIIIGAGAAGLLAAIEAGKRGRSVLVIERADKIGKKIRISGGGRCNFTNKNTSPENFVSKNIHFCKSALARYQPQDFIGLVEKHGIAYHEKKLGQLFCDKTSEDIVRLLEVECKAAKVEIQTNTHVESVVQLEKGFGVTTGRGFLECDSLIVATGGLSIPQMGATNFAHEMAEQFGLKVVPCRPGLVPLTWTKEDAKAYVELSGVSLDCLVSYGRAEFRENILFTHKGLSGPAILQISNYWEKGNLITIDLLPGVEVMDELVDGKKIGKDLVTVLARHFPKRFVQKWCEHMLPAKPTSNLTGKDLKAISELIHRWQVNFAGTEGFDKAEVTLGGVDTDELSSKTMEAKKVPGLYFVGEGVDVTGHLGGYNFQWAWASGYSAGQAA